jgi:phospholipase/carboxylesterase
MDAIQIETGPDPQAAVIWLHGLGADGHDFEPIVPELELAAPVRFVFPHAPIRPVTINQGMRMRAWYDILQLGGGPEDEAGLRASQKLTEELIRAQGLPAERIVLAGFSQGGAMALHTGLRHPARLAGILALSCFLPLAGHLAAEASAANREAPIFMAHGTQDDLIPIERARQAREALTRLGYAVEWHEYPMPHSVCDAEVLDIARWLARMLARRPGQSDPGQSST